MTARFFVPDPGEERRVLLPHDEGRHALRALRLRDGDPVVLFDGTNREHRGTLEVEEGRRAWVRIEETTVVDREPPVAVTLAVAVPKGERMEDLVRSCCELGAAAIVPVYTRRTVVRERPGRRGRGERLRRVAVEASKQCGRNRVTEILGPAALEDVLAGAGTFDRAMLATTRGEARPLGEALRGLAPGERVLVAIGPEGGFAAEEVERAAAAGLVPVTLGRPRYRVATAAIAALARVVAAAG